MVKKYNDMQLDLLIESIKNDETVLLLSPRFQNLLQYLYVSKNNNIARHILDNVNNKNFMTKITYVDIDDESDDMVTFITVSKALEIFDKQYQNLQNDQLFYIMNKPEYDIYKKNRSKSKIGRFISKLFGNLFIASGKPGEDIETFVNLFKSTRKKGVFEEVKGEDVKYWYLGKRYEDGGGKLNNSCMRYEDSQEYIDFYVINEHKVSLLILKDKKDSDKIKGRALLWKLDDPSGRTFMDRIYTVLDFDVENFINYAIENGFLYKKNQSMYENEEIVDPVGNVTKKLNLLVDDILSSYYYPYMDTLKYFNQHTNQLSNYEYMFNEYYKLENTDGSFDESEDSHEGMIWVERDGEWYEEDDIFMCNICDEFYHINDEYYSYYYEESICPDCLESHFIDCEYYTDSDHYRKSEDSVYLDRYDEYATQEYLNSSNSDFIYIENIDQWVKSDETVWSDHYNEYLVMDDAIEVYLDEDNNDTDWRIENDGTYFEHDGDYYDNDVVFSDDEEDS